MNKLAVIFLCSSLLFLCVVACGRVPPAPPLPAAWSAKELMGWNAMLSKVSLRTDETTHNQYALIEPDPGPVPLSKGISSVHSLGMAAGTRIQVIARIKLTTSDVPVELIVNVMGESPTTEGVLLSEHAPARGVPGEWQDVSLQFVVPPKAADIVLYLGCVPPPGAATATYSPFCVESIRVIR